MSRKTPVQAPEARPRPLPELAEELLDAIDVARNTESTYRNGLHSFAEFVLGDSGDQVDEALAPISALQEDSLRAVLAAGEVRRDAR